MHLNELSLVDILKLGNFSTNHSLFYFYYHCLKSQTEIKEVPLRFSSSPIISMIFMHTTGGKMSLLWTRLYFSLQPMHLSDLWWSVVISYYLYGSHTQGPK